MEILELAIVLIVGFISAFIGANVGGGGLITIPALIMLGLLPKVAIATMRVGSLGLIGGGLYKFNEKGKVNYGIALPAALVSLVGAYVGANALLELPDEIVSQMVGVFILIVLVFVVINRNIGIKKVENITKRSRLLGYLAFFILGFWGGVFGGGSGIFSAYILIFFFGQTFLEAAGTRKVPGLAVTILTLAVFALGGIVDWTVGGVLLIGMLLGSLTGATYGIKKGDGWVRALFIVMVLASAVKLIVFP